MNQLQYHIVIAAGGTAGHVLPGMTLARHLHQHGHKVQVITDQRGSRFVVADDEIPRHLRHLVSGAAVVGKSWWWPIYAGFCLAKALLQTWQLTKQFKAQNDPSSTIYLVVGFGSYAAFAAVIVGMVRGWVTVIHEQNRVMGLANRILARKVDLVLTAFPDTQQVPRAATPQYIGMPSAAVAVPVYSPPAVTVSKPNQRRVSKVRILVTGGSQGAQIFSSLVPQALANIKRKHQFSFQLVHQCPKQDLAILQEKYLQHQIAAQVAPFFADMRAQLAWCNLFIGRAGASSVLELTLTRRPGILIPYPFAAQQHQWHNAGFLHERNAAIRLNQATITADTLATHIWRLVSNPQRLTKMAVKAYSLSKNNAIADFVANIERVINKSTPTPAGGLKP